MRVSATFGDPLPEPTVPTADSSTPFRILVLGDFGARESWGKPKRVDRDNLDDVFAEMQIQLDLSLDSASPTVRFEPTEFEHFHPDYLFDELELFSALRTRRRRLQNTKTFDEEAKAILASASTQPAQSVSAIDPEPAPAGDVGSLLDQAIEQTAEAQKPLAKQIAEGSLNIDAYVRQLVEPYVVEKADPRQAEFVDGVDQAIAEAMRKLLHSGEFQACESAWLGIKTLVRRLETDGKLSIDLLNVSRTDLAADLTAKEDLASSQLYKLLAESTSVPGVDPWTIVIGDYAFDHTLEDSGLLGRIAKICASARCIFISNASLSVVGCENPAATPDPDDWQTPGDDQLANWNALRALPEATNLSLAGPRILVRYPYGAKSAPIESFKFEEIPDGSDHERYLWMNPAYGAAVNLGSAFSRAGWRLLSAWEPELDQLPTHIYKDGTESVMKPCGEFELILRGGEVLAAAGLTAVHSVRGKGAVLIPRLRSLSQDGTLACNWA